MMPRLTMRPLRIAEAMDVYDVKTERQLEARQLATVCATRRRLGLPFKFLQLFKVKDPVPARVNWGRLIVNCTTEDCNAGCAVDAKRRRAWCFNCGAIYTKVELPADYADLCGVLIERPRHMQNAEPGETAEDHHQENVRRGLGRREQT